MAKFGRQGRLACMMVMTGAFFLVEIIVGYLTGSLALVADSFHMLSDLIAMVVGFYAIRLAKRRRATKSNSFGWQRAEILGALANGVFLLALCFTIIIEAIQRFFEPKGVEDPKLVLIVGGVGLAINLVAMLLFSGSGHGHSHSHGGGHGHGSHSHEAEQAASSAQEGHGHSHGSGSGHSHSHGDGITDSHSHERGDRLPQSKEIEVKTQSDRVDTEMEQIEKEVLDTVLPSKSRGGHNMRAVFLHVLGDALGSVGVVVVALIVWLTDWSWRFYLDPVISLLITAMILFSTIPLVKDTSFILMQGVPGFDFAELRKALTRVRGVENIHELHVWRLADNKLVGSAHIKIKDATQTKEIVTHARRLFHQFDVHSSTLQIEHLEDSRLSEEVRLGNDTEDHESACLLTCEGPDCKAQACCPGEGDTSV